MDRSFALTAGKRVLYLTKDPDRIRRQHALCALPAGPNQVEALHLGD
jgi:hypothetical protein